MSLCMKCFKEILKTDGNHRLRMAQEIQRQLEECEVKTRELEERGVAVEKALRGEGVCITPWFSSIVDFQYNRLKSSVMVFFCFVKPRVA